MFTAGDFDLDLKGELNGDADGIGCTVLSAIIRGDEGIMLLPKSCTVS